MLRSVDLTVSIHEHAVRKLRGLRAQNVPMKEINEYIASLERALRIDGAQAYEQSKFPGPVNGYPFLANAELKAKRSAEHA